MRRERYDHIVKAKIERMIYRVRLIMHQIRHIAFGIISLQRKESGGAQDALQMPKSGQRKMTAAE